VSLLDSIIKNAFDETMLISLAVGVLMIVGEFDLSVGCLKGIITVKAQIPSFRLFC